MIPLAAICVALIAALAYERRAHARHLAQREKTWDLERGALLSTQASLEERHRSEREADRDFYAEDARRQAAEREEWKKERSELLTRIQHPNVVLPSVVTPSEAVYQPPEDDEIDQVGEIRDGEREAVNG